VGASAKSATNSSTGCRRWRYFCGSVLMNCAAFCSSSPGTSHSQRAAGTWLSAVTGTVSVTPSSSVPGSKW
jgi:hypothetical protein